LSMKPRSLLLLLTAVLLFTANLLAQDYSGTWVANIEKSKFGNSPHKSYVLKIEKIGPVTYLQTIDEVYPDGRQRHQQFARIYDGKEHPIFDDGKEPPGAPKGLTQICTPVDPLTRHIVVKQNGTVVLTIDSKMAPDKKTMINQMTFPARDGQEASVQTHVFERQ
jgi:hypothetical protein